ncbi:ABC transporter permease [Brevibacillus ruminantium]|uniref:ABC transporter permease n=1 Tax=Brevibacillus ruminantium TaxID=2950604 RepID=UPI00389958D8
MSNVSQLFWEEWRRLFANKTIRLVVFVVPLIYMTLFGFLYSEKKVTEIPTVVVDADQSELSRELSRAFDADQTFRVTHMVPTETEAMALIDKGEALVAVIIPNQLEMDVKAGREANVLTVIDGSNMMISNTAVRAANTVTKTVSAGVTLKKMEAHGGWGEEGKKLYTGIDYRYRVLYNPTFSYMSFMVFGLAGTVMQQVLFLGIALSVTQQKEEGTWRSTVAQHSFWAIAFSKLLPYLLVATFNLVLTFTLLLKGFGIPYYGSPGHLLLIGTAFNLAVLAIGFAISFYSKDQLQATQAAMMIAVPSFMLSGYTWPLMSMPTAIAAIGKSLPLTYFLDGVREILTKGHGLSAVTYHLAVLLFMTLLGLFAAYVTYLVQSKKASSAAGETTSA